MPRFARLSRARPPRCRRSYRDPVRYPRRRPRRPRRECDRPPRRPRRARRPTRCCSPSHRPTVAGRPVTTREFYDQVIALAKGLVAAGIQPGDKIGLMCKTRYEWTLIDFATWFAGAVLVPIYETSSPRRSMEPQSTPGAIAVILETPDHFARFDEVHPDCPRSATCGRSTSATSTSSPRRAPACPTRRSSGAQPRGRLRHRDAHLHLGIDRQAEGLRAHPLELRRALPQLRRGAQGGRVRAAARRRCSSSPPRTSSRGSSPCSRCTPACASGTSPTRSSCCRVLGSFKPTFLLAVPRVFEKVYNVSEQKAEAGGKGKIFRSRRRDRRRVLDGEGGRQGPVRPQGQVRALRPARATASSVTPWAAT
jgi:long-chain acyl-CoA synthetase